MCNHEIFIQSLGPPQSKREYWIMTEVFVYLHNGVDFCNCEKQEGKNMHHRPEKDPQEGLDSVTDRVIQDLVLRREAGTEKYGTELKSHNGRKALIDAYQEALDLCLYLKQELMERQNATN